MTTRPDWDEYFMGLVAAISERATCDRGRSGCVVVRDKRILCTGYVGSPAGFPHCDEAGHLFTSATDEAGVESQHCVRTVHAEQNAIAQAARHGIPLENSTFYCTMEPCRACAMLMVNVGAVRVVSAARYHKGGPTREILAKAGVELVVLGPEATLYDPDSVSTNRSSRAIGIGEYVEEELREITVADANGQGLCPNCGADLDGRRYGSGQLRDGVFCSLACYSGYYLPSARNQGKH